MSPDQTPRPPRQVTPCPWCGPGTPLTVRGDGFGATAVTCLRCGTVGPKTPLEGEFNNAEEEAIKLWSKRPQTAAVPRDMLDRVRLAIGLHCLSGELSPDATVSVPWSDLDMLLRAVSAPGHASR